uniref:valine--tRNA ligase n=1 Tax=Eutreptiella gymnastica TaxID=73025 RepID=A0A7S4GAC0_9EUGL
MTSIKPWCISRQLWWGLRIPAWYATLGERDVAAEEDVRRWIVARDVHEARERAVIQLELSAEDASRLVLHQDEDVLDTWFSAGLHPLYTLGWPDTSHVDFLNFFPVDVMETGHDILFFWVARMVMMSFALTDRLPFKEVYLHALVCDKDGRKMSKSLGNVIDPLDIISGISLEDMGAKLESGNLHKSEIRRARQAQRKQFPKGIPECGSDALRIGLLSYSVSGASVNLDVERIVGYRFFCNKLWNAVRYGLFHSLGEAYVPPSSVIQPQDLEHYPVPAQWILSRLDKAIADVHKGLESYDFALAVTAVYNFWLYDFCDVYLEITKPIMREDKCSTSKQRCQHVLWYSMEVGLRLLHPMMPFVTEALWHHLPGAAHLQGCESIMMAAYPKQMGYRHEALETQMEMVKAVVHGIRSVKSSLAMTNKERPDVHTVCTVPGTAAFLLLEASDIAFLSACGNVVVHDDRSLIPTGCVTHVVDQYVSVHVLVQGMIDPDKQIQKLNKQKMAVLKDRENLQKRMDAPEYRSKVPQNIQVQNAQRVEAMHEELGALEEAIVEMQQLKEPSS